MADTHPPVTVDLIVPARDEEANMAALFVALAALPEGLLRRVIVVDNGSTDRTAALARAGGAVVVHEPQPGYGAACQAALAWIEQQAAAGGAGRPGVVAFLDADLSDDPAQLPAVCGPVCRGEADLVLAARARLAEPGALEPHQRFGNWLACTLIGLATGRRYRDLGPMRAIRYASLRQLAMRDRTWGWTVEMQYKAARQGLRVIEHDVVYRCRHAGRSKISGSVAGSVRAGTRIISTIAALWWRGAGGVEASGGVSGAR